MTATPALAARVPLLKLDPADPELLEELLEVVANVAANAAFTLGSELEAFEDEFAAYCETDYALGVSSGTEALVLALRALEIGPGDEVIVPANSFIATAEAVSLVGATPRLVDVDPSTHLLTAEAVERAIGPRTRCVIPVHLMGSTVDMAPIVDVVRRAGVYLIEDCAQAHGARYLGQRVGTFGDLGCFSFYPTKNLGAWGDGGAVITGDERLADRVRLLRSHGEGPRYHHSVVGTTARLDALQAALLRVKLQRLEDWNEDRRRVGAALQARLEGTSLELPAASSDAGDHVYHLFVARTERRDELRAFLDERGIATGVHYPIPIHRTGAYADLGHGEGSLPVTERLAEQIITLPLFPSMTPQEIERVVSAVKDFDMEAS